MSNASVTSNHGPRTGPARDSPMYFISYGTRTAPVLDPQGCRTISLRIRKGIDTTRICKTPARESYVAVRAVHGLFMISKSVPYGGRKFMMHALKLYGSRTGNQIRTAPHGSRMGPVSGRIIFCSKQPGNSPYGVPCHVAWALLKTSKTFICNRRGRRLNVQYMSVIE